MVSQRSWLILLALLIPLMAWAGGPSIVLKDFAGKDRNVNEFIGKGKWAVVVVWAHDCHVCNEEIHHVNAFHDAHKDKDAIVLGVSIDGYDQKALAQAFVDKHSLRFPNLIAEPEQEVMMKFGAGPFIGTPTYYVYTPDGELVGQNVGAVTKQELDDFVNDYTAETESKDVKG